MNINQFNEVYKQYKDADIIEIKCDCPTCIDPIKKIKKVSAKRNITKRDRKRFICRDCYMEHHNPLFNPPEEKRQTDEIVNVKCPDCGKAREIKKACYFGSLQEPYQQICGSCVQKGKVISQEQRDKISEALYGRELSEEHKKKLSDYMKNNPEGIERGKANLIAGYSSGWNKGMTTPPEVAEKISLANMGLKRTEEQRQHISEGRKKMLEAQGGLLPETKEKLSLAAIKQYQDGFEPKLYHRRGKHTTKTGEVYSYKSSYEKKAFMLLDADANVESYEYEPFAIAYKRPYSRPDDIGTYTANYLIDLLVTYKDGSKKLIEVKPQRRIDRGVLEKIKLAAAEKFAKTIGFEYETWTEKELFGNSEKDMREFCESLDKLPFTH